MTNVSEKRADGSRCWDGLSHADNLFTVAVRNRRAPDGRSRKSATFSTQSEVGTDCGAETILGCRWVIRKSFHHHHHHERPRRPQFATRCFP